MSRFRSAALPFVIHREHGVIKGSEILSTRDALHGLLRLAGDRLVVQWRTSREVSRVGREISTDRSLAPLREIHIPLTGIASARTRWTWRSWWPRTALTIVAADLRVFDPLAGDAEVPGLVLEHPGELVLEVRRTDRELARNFVSELRLAVSEEMLRALEESEADHARITEGAALPLSVPTRSELETAGSAVRSSPTRA